MGRPCCSSAVIEHGSTRRSLAGRRSSFVSACSTQTFGYSFSRTTTPILQRPRKLVVAANNIGGGGHVRAGSRDASCTRTSFYYPLPLPPAGTRGGRRSHARGGPQQTYAPEPCEPPTTPCTTRLPGQHMRRERHRVGLSCELAPHMDRCKFYRTRPARPVTNFTLSRTAWTRGLGVIRRRLVALRA